MGLYKDSYRLEDFNLTITPAYALCLDIRSGLNGEAIASFGVFQSRADAFNGTKPFEEKNVSFIADKKNPVWEQAYVEAKRTVFEDWTDDIPDTSV